MELSDRGVAGPPRNARTTRVLECCYSELAKPVASAQPATGLKPLLLSDASVGAGCSRDRPGCYGLQLTKLQTRSQSGEKPHSKLPSRAVPSGVVPHSSGAALVCGLGRHSH